MHYFTTTTHRYHHLGRFIERNRREYGGFRKFKATQQAGHGDQPTLGREKVFFSPAVKLKASQATTEVPRTSRDLDLKSVNLVSPQGDSSAQNDGRKATQPTQGATGGPTGARSSPTVSPGPREGRNSGGAQLFSHTSASEDEAGSTS